jgi:hypothetical protein
MSDAPAQPKNRRTAILFAVAVLIGALILLIAVEWGSLVGTKPTPPLEPPKAGAISAPAKTVAVEPAAGPTAVRAFASRPEAPAEPVPGNQAAVAATLNDPASDVRHDLGVIAELFAHFQGEFRELPVGNNAEITAALAGDNSRAYAILPADHRAINADGELTDRWGTPYFFHQLAGDLMEIRSSGPDRRRYTADDAVWPAATALAAGGSAGDNAATVAAQ